MDLRERVRDRLREWRRRRAEIFAAHGLSVEASYFAGANEPGWTLDLPEDCFVAASVVDSLVHFLRWIDHREGRIKSSPGRR